MELSVNIFRAEITQGGLNKQLQHVFSTQWKICHTVDKDNNFLKAIQEVLNEPSYRTNMQRLSRLHRDTPMKPMDTALFWIEFVMRHKGAAHLRTESYRLPWYSYHSVDVVLFLAGAVLLMLCTIFLSIKCLYTTMFKRKAKRD